MKSGNRFTLLVYSFLFICLVFATAGFAEKKEPSSGKRESKNELSVINLNSKDASAVPTHLFNQITPNIPLGQNFVQEIEPNNTTATAQSIAGSAVINGNIFPVGDNDVFSFTAAGGDRVYAATMTSFSPSGGDTVLDVISTDGTTVLETDDEDGSLNGNSSSISGTLLPAPGTYFIRVRGFSPATTQIRPYRLSFRLQTGAPVAEVEPNDSTATAMPLPVSGWITGSRSAATDVDWYTLPLNAGDTVYASLDADPLRDNTQWDTRLGVAIFGTPPSILVVADTSAPSVANPTSEAIFMTVKDAGTYYVYVDSALATFGDYSLSVTVYPAAIGTCTTYTSTNVPQSNTDGSGIR